MNADRSEQIIRRVAGYWPTPPLLDEEAVAWTEALTDPEIDVTPDEALTVIRKAVYAGDVHRPRPGRLLAAVRVERRWERTHDDSRALTAASDAVPPERASRWLRACRRVLAGETLADAKRAEGLVA